MIWSFFSGTVQNGFVKHNLLNDNLYLTINQVKEQSELNHGIIPPIISDDL